MKPDEGLGEVWQETEEALIKTIPVYDRGNQIMSFGRDRRYRREGITQAVKRGDQVLDLGCGPGTMSQILLDTGEDIGGLVLADPLGPMLSVARVKVSADFAQMASGIFEYLPFRDDVFDVVMCGFSFRDAQSYQKAVEEMARVLKQEDGRLLIVDLGKPDEQLRRGLIGLYFRFVAGVLTFLILGRKGLAFSRIYPTYRKYPTISRIRSLLESQFENVTIETRMIGGVLIAIARQPKSK
ncbi:MAG: class I SAM-dependent methyltransferase [Thaumarchaeota archaeon]|nr:class I SAM-dependent methyltransferase [Nitrososphaerota archaeon]MCL5319014.1 class I SAM-dependent methyltransferase [Nitrososphaerota archaeon]